MIPRTNVIKLSSTFDLVLDQTDTDGTFHSGYTWRLSPNTTDSTRAGKNLLGAPERLTGDLQIGHVGIESLEGCPSHIDNGYLGLVGLSLESLEHIATTVDDTLLISACDRLTRLDLPDEVRTSFDGIKVLRVHACANLSALGRLPVSLNQLTVTDCQAMKTLEIDNSLERLDFLEINAGAQHSLETLEDLYASIKTIGYGGFAYNFVNRYDHPSRPRARLPAGLLTLMRMNISGPIEFIVSGSGDISKLALQNTYLMKVLNKWKNQGRRGILGAQRELLNCPDFDFSLQATL